MSFNQLALVIAQKKGYGNWVSIGFMVLVFLIFYFLLIRPQQKKEKDRQRQIAAITKGDKIVTTGGLVAVVSDIKDDVIVCKIGVDVKIEIMKNAVQQVTSK
jgi:preprotein translocase subunit YajC